MKKSSNKSALELPRWAMGDPARVSERIEEMRTTKSDVARKALELIFSGGDMAREMDFRLRIEAELHARLENWGWVMRDRVQQGTSSTWRVCHQLAILAGAYKHDEYRPAPTRDQSADAFLIEKAWANPLMPTKPKMLLAGYYVYRLHPHKLSRAASLRYADFDEQMKKGCDMLKNIEIRLAKRSDVVQNRNLQLDSRHDHHDVAE